MWNRCADAKPPKNKQVLCLGAKGGYFIGRYIKDELFYTVGGSGLPRNAVYWMELLTAPLEMTRSGDLK